MGSDINRGTDKHVGWLRSNSIQPRVITKRALQSRFYRWSKAKLSESVWWRIRQSQHFVGNFWTRGCWWWFPPGPWPSDAAHWCIYVVCGGSIWRVELYLVRATPMYQCFGVHHQREWSEGGPPDYGSKINYFSNLLDQLVLSHVLNNAPGSHGRLFLLVPDINASNTVRTQTYQLFFSNYLHLLRFTPLWPLLQSKAITIVLWPIFPW